MGSLFRSEEMALVQILCEHELAHDTVDELGELGIFAFKDLNKDKSMYQRNFVKEIKRCEEIERRVRFVNGELIKIQIEERRPFTEIFRPDVIEEHRQVDILSVNDLTFDRIASKFEELEIELRQNTHNEEAMLKKKNHVIELQHILDKASEFFDEASVNNKEPGNEPIFVSDDVESQPIMSSIDSKSHPESTKALLNAINPVKIRFVTGVLLQDRIPTFERILWRTTRGNMFLRYKGITTPIMDPSTCHFQFKTVFIIFFQGSKLQTKIIRICETFGANVYNISDNTQERYALREEANFQLKELNNVIDQSKTLRIKQLGSVASVIIECKHKILREKAIYDTLNKFNYDPGRKCMIAEGWCPQTDLDQAQLALRKARQRSSGIVPSVLSTIQSTETPPTYFKTNKYTYAFQEIVDAYGIAHYREINPSVFTIITFPFLFGVMFGDIGHGFIMALFAFYLLWNESNWNKKSLGEISRLLFEGRYIILLMALFSIYVGYL